jgi:hypothetical protein
MAPEVEVRISTSSPVLDINSRELFSIKLQFLLKADLAITFRKSDSILDGVTAMRRETGLGFLNTPTGELNSRQHQTDICKIGDGESQLIFGGLIAATASEYITLYPGQEQIVNLELGPRITINRK